MGRKKIRPKTYDGFWESFVEVRVLNVPDLSTNPVAVRLTAWRATASSSAHAAVSHFVRVNYSGGEGEGIISFLVTAA